MVRRHRNKKRLHRRISDPNGYLPKTLTQDVITFIQDLDDGGDFKISYLKSVFLSKFVSEDTDSSDVRRQRAINKWLAVERENAATEDRLLITTEEYNILPRVTFQKFVHYARDLIAHLLGDTVPVEALLGGFSGGASTSRSRTDGHPALKYLGIADITAAARPWFDLVKEESCLWNIVVPDFSLREVKGNHMFTVPKTANIDRCAAKEPDLNMYMQRGVGNYIRRMLRTVGINLNDQSRNQRLARKGSIDGTLATLDLSSASDSVTSELVELLLPDLWFGCLRDLRCPFTLIDGEWHENYMFSSMGNGFTFELESLIFWALARTTRDLTRNGGIISIYGDDIIVGSRYAEALSWVLSYFGFSVNSEKSFITGPFRESCGGHYHNGRDVTPFYLRRPLLRMRDAIVLANQIRKWSQDTVVGVLDTTLEPLWEFLKSYISSRVWGGVELGSDSQLVSHDPPSWRMMAIQSKPIDTLTGGYLLWLNSCEDSSQIDRSIQTSTRSVDTAKYRLKRSGGSRRFLDSLFLHEIFD